MCFLNIFLTKSDFNHPLVLSFQLTFCFHVRWNNMLNDHAIDMIDNNLSNHEEFYCFTCVKCQVLFNKMLLPGFVHPLLTKSCHSFLCIYTCVLEYTKAHTHTNTYSRHIVTYIYSHTRFLQRLFQTLSLYFCDKP